MVIFESMVWKELADVVSVISSTIKLKAVLKVQEVVVKEQEVVVSKESTI